MVRRIYNLVKTIFLLLALSHIPSSAQISFAPVKDYPLTAAPFRVVVGDINGDGKPDLVTLSIYGGTVSTLLNHGNGTFAPPRGFAALSADPAGPTFFSGITLGDVNGDHKLDVILGHTTDVNSGDGVINVLLGNGDGTLQPSISTAVGSYAYRFVGVGDFNSDSHLDVACIADDPANTMQLVVLFLGNGDGTFARFDSSQEALMDAALADVNHDNKLDVVVPGTVLLGNGDGTFQTRLDAPTTVSSMFFSVRDFNHDATTDLLTTSYQQYRCVCPGFGAPPSWVAEGPPGSANLLVGKGDGTFGGPTLIAKADFMNPVVGDFDGDGNLDFAAAALAGPPPLSYSGSFAFFLGNGHAGFSAPTNIVQPVTDVITVDVDGDGFADLVWPTPSSLQVALNDTSTFSLTASEPGPPIPAGGTASYAISVTQQHGQTATMTITCSAPAGSRIGCSVSPQSVAAGATATLSVTTTGGSAELVPHQLRVQRSWRYALWLPAAVLFLGGAGVRGGPLRRKKLPGLIVGCLLCVGLIFQVACGGSSPLKPNIGTPPGMYTITVTGTAGTISRSTTVNLTVQ